MSVPVSLWWPEQYYFGTMKTIAEIQAITDTGRKFKSQALGCFKALCTFA
jgi:hypothetical protein